MSGLSIDYNVDIVLFINTILVIIILFFLFLMHVVKNEKSTQKLSNTEKNIILNTIYNESLG